ncbi:MAG: hypothetical protein ACI4ML_06040, partial [Aristaeellaceae bacterium]
QLSIVNSAKPFKQQFVGQLSKTGMHISFFGTAAFTPQSCFLRRLRMPAASLPKTAASVGNGSVIINKR